MAKRPGVSSSQFFVLALLVSLLASSCAAHLSSDEFGKLTIALTPARGAVTGWPDGSPPSFSSVVVTVSGDGMDTLTTTASAGASGITVQVPAGDDRLVKVVATPAPASGAPHFAAAYSGSASADVKEGESVNVTITLSIAQTKIALPRFDTYGIRSAESLSGTNTAVLEPGVFFDPSFDFDFDEYGRFFFSDGEVGLRRITTVAGGIDSGISTNAYTGFSYDRSLGRIYYIYEGYLCILNADGTPGAEIPLPPTLMGTGSSIASDGNTVFVDGYDQYENPVIAKMVLDGSTVASTTIVSQENAIGSDLLTVRDMVLVDSVLYIAAAQVIQGNNSVDIYSRGKVVAVNPATMEPPIWETGWSSTQVQSVAGSKLCGAGRFVGFAPGKLYLIDSGFLWNGLIGANLQDVARIVEVDLTTRSISGSGLDDKVNVGTAYGEYTVDY